MGSTRSPSNYATEIEAPNKTTEHIRLSSELNLATYAYPTQTWNRNIDKTELKPKSVHQAVEMATQTEKSLITKE